VIGGGGVQGGSSPVGGEWWGRRAGRIVSGGRRWVGEACREDAPREPCQGQDSVALWVPEKAISKGVWMTHLLCNSSA